MGTPLKVIITELLSHPTQTPAEVMERYFDASFRQRINGTWIDRDTFLSGIVQIRKTLAHVTVTVLDEFDDGSRYVERHVIHVENRDGVSIVREVWVFAERTSEGRFSVIEEVTLPFMEIKASDEGPVPG